MRPISKKTLGTIAARAAAISALVGAFVVQGCQPQDNMFAEGKPFAPNVIANIGTEANRSGAGGFQLFFPHQSKINVKYLGRPGLEEIVAMQEAER